jgi:hypothetical protein
MLVVNMAAIKFVHKLIRVNRFLTHGAVSNTVVSGWRVAVALLFLPVVLVESTLFVVVNVDWS